MPETIDPYTRALRHRLKDCKTIKDALRNPERSESGRLYCAGHKRAIKTLNTEQFLINLPKEIDKIRWLKS